MRDKAAGYVKAEKKAGMAPFLIVLLVVLAAYWLYRQRTKPRASRQALKPPPTANVLIAIEQSKIESPHLEVLQSDAHGDAEATRRRASDEAENVIELQRSPLEKEEIGSDISNALNGVEAPASDQLHLVEPAFQTDPTFAISGESPFTDKQVGTETSQPDSHTVHSAESTANSSMTATVEITNNSRTVLAEAGSGEPELTTASSIHVFEEPNREPMEESAAQQFLKSSENETGRPAQRHRPPPTEAGSGEPELTTASSIHVFEEPNREPMEESAAQQFLKSPENEAGRPAQRYRPPTQKSPRTASTRTRSEEPNGKRSSESALDIFVHLTFDRSSFCTIGFLPKLAPELGEEVDAMSGKEAWRLLAQEDWYQDIQPEDMGDRLRYGIELRAMSADQRPVRWQLKGRDFCVLAGHPRASGYLSTPRLLLGRTDVVLCINEMASEVESVLAAAGCEGYTKIGESLGVPAGWVGFRGVLPTKALSLDSEVDQLYALKPAPDIEIDFEGGIRLRNSIWLAGYPPQIKLYGQTNSAGRILIDGKEAEGSAEGSLIADGYDQVGDHSVYCEGQSRSRTYSVEAPPDSWDRWTSYRFERASVCGPLVQLESKGVVSKPITIPMSNPVLVGSEPGQIFQCSARSVGRWRGFVPFDVVWALPAQPFTSDKRTARIIQFADKPIAPVNLETKRAVSWCNAILDASRKGLRIESDYSDSSVRWREYRNAARKLQRTRR